MGTEKMTKNQTGRQDKEESLVRKLALILSETGLTEIEVESQELRVRVAKNNIPNTQYVNAPAASQPLQETQSQPSKPAVSEKTTHENALNAPMVGTVYLSPKPGAPSFVSVGDTVKEGQTLLIIEAMKVMNPVPAPRAGKITHINVTDATPVEFGQPLLVIE